MQKTNITEKEPYGGSADTQTPRGFFHTNNKGSYGNGGKERKCKALLLA